MNDEAARPDRLDTSIDSPPDLSTGGGVQSRLVIVGDVLRPRERPRLRTPRLVIEVPLEGTLTIAIRGALDEQDAGRLRAWLHLDPELRALTEIARRLRDRRSA